MSAPLAWITGAGGLIGSHLVRAAPRSGPAREVVGWTRNQLDLADADAMRRAFRHRPPDLVIHCAALSRSAACEEDPALAQRLNVDVTARLAELSAEIPFLFLSSDLVFDGRRGNYNEDDPPGPLSAYARTKLAAERIVLANPRHSVIRASLNGGVSPTGDRGFNETMRLAWQHGRPVKLFTDEFRSPLPASVTARAIWELAGCNRPGLYHLGGSERLSRWEIGRLIAGRWPQLNPRLEPCSRRDFAGPPRPGDTSLNCTRLQALLSFRLPGLGEWLNANPEEVF